MRKLTFSTLIAVVLSLLAMPAMATVVNFDNLPTPLFWVVPNAYGDFGPLYGGLSWTGWEVMNRPAYNAIYGQNEVALPSEPNFAYGGNDTATLTVSSVDPFNFLGAQFASWQGGQGLANSVAVRGYLGANLVGTVSMGLLPAWAPLSGGIAGVDRLEFSTNLGTGMSAGYFRMDNLNYEPVPEPLTLLLIGGGLLAFGGLRRRKTAAG